eukprot:TRINITY_DN2078_c0_g1_i1.p2 TRINITY_DN2078_c0_g1~~TRINITY_DN2078_c0_g1_i1.p2  ORF type:complete len:240 (-),score=63.30 TRINITY_DN2078_c0_g1_i1:25-744(-)
MRWDALGHLLNYGNIRAGNRVIVMETSLGLVTASCVSRMGGMGSCYQVFAGAEPKLSACQQMNFTQAEMSMIVPISAKSLDSFFDDSKGVHRLPDCGADSLLLCSQSGLANMLTNLWPYLAPSGAFAVYSPTIEPLAEIQMQLQRSRSAVHLGVCESFMREWQVLPQRTHPDMSLTDMSGYVLRGYKIGDSTATAATARAKRVRTDEQSAEDVKVANVDPAASAPAAAAAAQPEEAMTM